MSTTGGGGKGSERVGTSEAASSSRQPGLNVEPTEQTRGTSSASQSHHPQQPQGTSHSQQASSSPPPPEPDRKPSPTQRRGAQQTAASRYHHASSQQQQQQPSQITPQGSSDSERPRQVIAVSASKGPAAFFNLARKFLVTDEMCDLSALEGAIVSAVDAAHLLERSKLATIVRVETSYVSVEPKRKRQHAAAAAAQIPEGSEHSHQQQRPAVAYGARPPIQQQQQSSETHQQPPRGRGAGRELRRARIVITVKRTESYKQWLEENPLQAMIAGDGDEEELGAEGGTPSAGRGSGPSKQQQK